MPRSLKILHLARRYWPDKGGVETHVQALCRELIKQGHTCQVLTTQTTHDQPFSQTQSGVQITRIKKETWKEIGSHLTLLQNADVIQVHDVAWWLLPWWLRYRKKMYVTFHGWEGEYPVKWRKKIHRWIVAQVARKTIHIGDWIQEFYWDEPDEVVYGGVDTSRAKAITKSSSDKIKLQIAFIGRLEPENDIELYLDLVETLGKETQVMMNWVGDGSYRQACEQLGQVTGMVENPSTHLSDVAIVFASSYLSILDAMGQGKIVCAFYSHRLKQRYLETFPGAKHMIMSNSVSSMKEDILQIMSTHSLLQKKAKKARQFAETMTWQNVAETYLRVWDK